ncbi:hypothetical protein M378DRAFT_173859 [Amanita muscaria Koide BX008]|uniref:Uncharacterized protein n=1 Tax=Amanita muscaria (strain Koide BX008) TaxID=946122 RepID=A0A0C2WEU9_AMAMK|nr:hypothetical protein M378DRAFT_173859 [Amanita muscaria Koide BX008]
MAAPASQEHAEIHVLFPTKVKSMLSMLNAEKLSRKDVGRDWLLPLVWGQSTGRVTEPGYVNGVSLLSLQPSDRAHRSLQII